jgi:tetratricopeptide (TPR) repeat protein
MTYFLRAVVLVALALAIPISTASAQSTPPDCTEDLQKGISLAKAGQRDEARTHLARAYSVCKLPVALFNIGMTYRQDKQSDEAIKYMSQFLKEAPANHQMRAVAEKVILELSAPEKAPPRDKSEPDTKISRLQDRVDNFDIDSDSTDSNSVVRQPQIQPEIQPELQPETQPEPEVQPETEMQPEPETQPGGSPSGYRLITSDALGMALLAGGVAGVSVGLVYYTMAAGDVDAAKETNSFVEHAKLEDQAQSRLNVSFVSLAIGGAILGGAYWRYRSLKKRQSAKNMVSVAPVLGPGFAGVSIGGEL